jgi:hypothetical protein
LFRFCFKDFFPELLGDARELRKTFFENINIKPVTNESWYTSILEQILNQKSAGLPIDSLQNQIEETLFDLYNLSVEERTLIKGRL